MSGSEKVAHVVYSPQIQLKAFGAVGKGHVFSQIGSINQAYDWLGRLDEAAELCNWNDTIKLAHAKNLLEGYNAQKAIIQTWEDFRTAFLERSYADTTSVVTALYAKKQHHLEPVRVYADELLNMHDCLTLTDGPLPPRVLTT